MKGFTQHEHSLEKEKDCLCNKNNLQFISSLEKNKLTYTDGWNGLGTGLFCDKRQNLLGGHQKESKWHQSQTQKMLVLNPASALITGLSDY